MGCAENPAYLGWAMRFPQTEATCTQRFVQKWTHPMQRRPLRNFRSENRRHPWLKSFARWGGKTAPHPCRALSWKISPDGREWLLRLNRKTAPKVIQIWMMSKTARAAQPERVCVLCRPLPDKATAPPAAIERTVAVLVRAGPAISATQNLGSTNKPVIERMVGRCNSDGETAAVTGQHG